MSCGVVMRISAHAAGSGSEDGCGDASAAPVLNAKSGDASHVIEVGRDERRIEGEGVRRDGGIEIFDPCSPSFQRRLDVTVHLADDIGPGGSSDLHAEEIEARLQRGPPLRTGQSLDAKRDLRKRRARLSIGAPV